MAIYGLGLMGQVCCLLAKAAGAVVVGIDVSPERTALALKCGADHVINGASENVKRRISDLSAKHGVDATIICASSKSSDIINTATTITRRQGRVVIVGYVGLNIQPKDFLNRELDIRYSRAYGPGSYDAGYEKGRVDYPFGYVRWTENRNLGEIIRLLEVGAVRFLPLIGKTYPLAPLLTMSSTVPAKTSNAGFLISRRNTASTLLLFARARNPATSSTRRLRSRAARVAWSSLATSV